MLTLPVKCILSPPEKLWGELPACTHFLQTALTTQMPGQGEGLPTHPTPPTTHPTPPRNKSPGYEAPGRNHSLPGQVPRVPGSRERGQAGPAGCGLENSQHLHTRFWAPFTQLVTGVFANRRPKVIPGFICVISALPFLLAHLLCLVFLPLICWRVDKYHLSGNEGTQ